MNSAMLPVLSQEAGLQRYLEEIKLFPVLTDVEEYELALKWYNDGDLSAAHKLVTSHLRLVAKIAMQFKAYGLPLVDLISEGNLGLMSAIKKFNPHLGHRLATYAFWCIKSNIQDYILRSWSMVRMGSSIAKKKLFYNLRKIKAKLLQANNGQIPADQVDLIAHELDVDKHDVIEMDSRLSNGFESLDDHLYDDDDTEIIDQVAEPSDNQEIALLKSDEYMHRKKHLDQALSTLNDREREIIVERRLKDKPTRLDELSKRYNITGERIRQIEAKAMRKLISFVNEPQEKAAS